MKIRSSNNPTSLRLLAECDSLSKFKSFAFCLQKLIKALLLQLFLQTFTPFNILILGRKDLVTLHYFFFKCDHHYCICYNICFLFCMGLMFSYEQFLSISVFSWVFSDFCSFLITSFSLIPCFSRFFSG